MRLYAKHKWKGKKFEEQGEIEEYKERARVPKKVDSQVNGIKRIGSQKTNYSENQKLSIQSSLFPSFRSIRKDKERSNSGWEIEKKRVKAAKAWAWTTINNGNCANVCACICLYKKEYKSVWLCIFGMVRHLAADIYVKRIFATLIEHSPAYSLAGNGNGAMVRRGVVWGTVMMEWAVSNKKTKTIDGLERYKFLYRHVYMYIPIYLCLYLFQLCCT